MITFKDGPVLSTSNWMSYHHRGWILNNENRPLEAIDVFHKSLNLKEHWNTYQGLGWALNNARQHLEAVDVFRKSIALKEDGDSYCGLGWALNNVCEFTEAIDAFHKSLAFKEHWNTYRGLGWALYNANQFQEAIDVFHKSLAFKEHWNTYNGLGQALFNTNQLKEAEDNIIRASKNYSLLREPIVLIDPFLGNGGSYEKVDSEQLEQLKSICSNYGYEFNSSFEGGNDPYLESWKYLMYLHIPKCGGSSFEKPLHLLKNNLVHLSRDLKGTHRYLNSSNQLLDGFEVASLKKLISSSSCKDLKSVFVATHGAPWSDLHQHISKTINVCPRIIATVRDPHQRLMSHIRHEARLGISGKIMDVMIEKEDCQFRNIIHKNIFDYGLRNNFFTSNNDRSKLIDNIDFIDMSDSLTIAKVKSAFLSASSLPNIVQYSRLNDSKDYEKEGNFRLSKHEIEHAFKRCVDKGYVEKDDSIDYEFLKKRTLNRLHFPSYNDYNIHPVTFIISKYEKSFLIPTEKFLSNSVQILQEVNSQ